MSHFLRRLGSFARVLVFDRRGVGLSDPVSGAPTLEEHQEVVRERLERPISPPLPSGGSGSRFWRGRISTR
jgi:pimeloyl-ACP methyl ester carboxylesterase